MALDNLKKRLQSREILFGAWTSLAHPSITEMFCSIMKPDFLGIDIEHGTFSQEQCQQIIAAGQACGVPVLPRAASHNGEQIRRLCDSGADGLLVPTVNSRKEAEQILDWFKYPPAGRRGYGVARAQGYGAQFDAYTRTWNERSVFIPQIESIGAVEAIDEILDNEHVDGVMIGPYDISGSLKIPGRLNDPKVLQACDRVISACAKHKKGCGTQDTDPSPESVRRFLDRGFTFVVLSSDIFLMWRWSESMRRLTGQIRESLPNP